MKKDLTLPFPIYIVDAFASVPFSGNPAGVCFLTDNRPEAWMQKVANEMNQAETAFFRPMDEEGHFQLRWFTPTVEVDLCGHATLATAHVIWSTDMAERDAVLHFHTRSGILTAQYQNDMIQLDFPAQLISAVPVPEKLEEALGCSVTWFGKAGADFLAVVATPNILKDLKPDLAYVNKLDARGLIVTAEAEKSSVYDFHSRFFAPQVGVPEDPATGSTHCALAPFWAERLKKKDMLGYQASVRGGEIRVVLNPAKPGRVMLLGKTFTMMQGLIADSAPLS